MMEPPTTLTPADIEREFSREDAGCVVGKMLAQQDSDVRAVLESKLAAVERYSSPTIVKVFKALGLGSFGKDAITNHRKGTCRCG